MRDTHNTCETKMWLWERESRCSKVYVRKGGFGCRAVVTGPTIHNQRIERLWRDFRRIVIQLYQRLFPHMEDSGMLDINNQVHLFCLHYIFKARVNDALKQFVQARNSRPISGECNRSPNQLVITGLLGNFHTLEPDTDQVARQYAHDVDDEEEYGAETRRCKDIGHVGCTRIWLWSPNKCGFRLWHSFGRCAYCACSDWSASK